MENLLEGMLLTVAPGSSSSATTNAGKSTRLSFTLPASNVLAEAGSASFLEDGPPRPETHPHVDDILDAWTLYNLWEHSGAWEALQNDYRIVLSRSMQGDAGGAAGGGGGGPGGVAAAGGTGAGGGEGDDGTAGADSESAQQPRLRERLGKA